MFPQLETSEIYKVAYHVSMGARIDALEIGQGGRARFIMSGDDLRSNETGYQTGQALVNPRSNKQSLNNIREMITKRQNKRKLYDKKARRKKR